MSVSEAVEECLLYIRHCVPAVDEAAIRAPLHLLDNEHSLWDELLTRAPAAVAFRSEALKPFIQLLNFPELFKGLDKEFTAFRMARQRLTAAATHVKHHADLKVERELYRAFAFILIEPGASLSDGAARAASNGYFDDNNMPPWDTWVMPVHAPRGSTTPGDPALLCWVPEWAHEHVDAGICVNPEQCLHWVEIQDDTVMWR